MMIAVYHVRHELTRDQMYSVMFPTNNDELAISVAKLWAEGGYVKVADVDAANLEVAYRLTNNIDTSWSREPDPRVTPIEPVILLDGEEYGRKSSAMGDVFFRDTVAHVVAMVGFAKVDSIKEIADDDR